MHRSGYINLMFVGHTIEGCAYMTVENVHSVAVYDRQVIYKVEERGYIEFCDSTCHTIRATEVLPYERIEETFMCDVACTVYNFRKGDVVAVVPRPPPFRAPHHHPSQYFTPPPPSETQASTSQTSDQAAYPPPPESSESPVYPPSASVVYPSSAYPPPESSESPVYPPSESDGYPSPACPQSETYPPSEPSVYQSAESFAYQSHTCPPLEVYPLSEPAVYQSAESPEHTPPPPTPEVKSEEPVKLEDLNIYKTYSNVKIICETTTDYILGLGSFGNVFLPKSVYYLDRKRFKSKARCMIYLGGQSVMFKSELIN